MLPVSDLEVSKRFYAEHLGLGCREDDGCVYLTAAAGPQIMLHGPHGDDDKIPPDQRMEIWLRVDGIDDFVEELRGRGVTVASAPKDMPWGARIVGLRDPDGYEVWLSQPTG